MFEETLHISSVINPLPKDKILDVTKLKALANESQMMIFSSTGRRSASYCHGVVSVMHLSVCPAACVRIRKLFLQKTSPQKLLTGFLQNFTGMFLRLSSFKFLQ